MRQKAHKIATVLLALAVGVLLYLMIFTDITINTDLHDVYQVQIDALQTQIDAKDSLIAQYQKEIDSLLLVDEQSDTIIYVINNEYETTIDSINNSDLEWNLRFFTRYLEAEADSVQGR